METDQTQNFNERLSQWVANQGFWFQVRYSMSGQGMKGRAMFHFVRISFRIFLFLILIAAGLGVYLMKRPNSESFTKATQSGLKSGLSAKELEMIGLNRLQGQLEISRLAAEGANDTFFTSLEARNIRCNMGLVDGMMGPWNPGIISVAKLDVELRAGADDAESAKKWGEAFFRKPDQVQSNAFEVQNATVTWGFSERTQGGIESSSLKAQRTETGWRMNFKGGYFSQNWLQKLEIVNLLVICEPDGLFFEKVELKQGDGTVDFSGLRVLGGERPEVQGLAKIRNLKLEGILPKTLRSFVEGTISGDFRVFGSTNNSDGLGFEGQVVLDGKDMITLRERLHLLKALSVVDFSRNYHRIDFREGSFQMKTIRGGLELTEVKLKAEETLMLEGAMKVRLPTQEEIQQALTKGATEGGGVLFAGEEEGSLNSEISKSEESITLKRAALEEKRQNEGQAGMDAMNLFDRLGLSLETKRLQNQASGRMSRMLRYDGAFVASVPGDAFERAPRLLASYPVDASGRIGIRVPIEGNLFELTLKQAEDIYQQAQRK